MQKRMLQEPDVLPNAVYLFVRKRLGHFLVLLVTSRDRHLNPAPY